MSWRSCCDTGALDSSTAPARADMDDWPDSACARASQTVTFAEVLGNVAPLLLLPPHAASPPAASRPTASPTGTRRILRFIGRPRPVSPVLTCGSLLLEGAAGCAHREFSRN